jgi:acetyl esterase/lipase
VGHVTCQFWVRPWLTHYGDFNNVFVVGFSSGGNVVHNIALQDVHFKGLVLIHPYFITNKKLPSEPTDLIRTKLEELWYYVCPGTSGLDDPRANPEAKGAPSLKELNCDRVLVCLAEDSLMLRGKVYYEALKESGWGPNAELFESPGQGHGFFLDKPDSEAAHEMMSLLLAFIKHKQNGSNVC